MSGNLTTTKMLHRHDTCQNEANSGIFNPPVSLKLEELGGASNAMLAKLVQNRRSPGMLILTNDGSLLFMNATAKQYLTGENTVDEFLAELRRQVLAHHQPPMALGSLFSDSTANLPVIQLLFLFGTSWCVLRGFWLESAGCGSSPVMGIVIESINLTRLDMHRARELYKLSPREVAIIRALAIGKTDKEIALMLKMSPETVRWHLKSVRTKMGVKTRTSLVHKLLIPDLPGTDRLLKRVG